MSQTKWAERVPGLKVAGALYHPGLLTASGQEELVTVLQKIVAAAPLFQPVMPRTGKPFSVSMTNCGPLGWVSDRSGYRYQPLHPDTGKPWPALPQVLLDLWDQVAGDAPPPEACLVNVYGATAKMGSHQDRDEADFTSPVVSISLGCDARFHIGGPQRSDAKTRITLNSGDVVVLGGASRLAFHGIDRVIAGTSTLDLSRFGPRCSRLNLTLRRVSPR